jgi:hypothetical protein
LFMSSVFKGKSKLLLFMSNILTTARHIGGGKAEQIKWTQKLLHQEHAPFVRDVLISDKLNLQVSVMLYPKVISSTPRHWCEGSKSLLPKVISSTPRHTSPLLWRIEITTLVVIVADLIY